MRKEVKENSDELSQALDVIARITGWAADEIALVLEHCADRLEGDRVAKRIAEYKKGEYTGWIALNMKDGNITEVRVNPEVHGGIVTEPESRNPFKKYLRQHYSHNHRET
jgi:hypothetical protein